jgi:WhiB family redox-sensing transcriptional regulator
MTARGLCSSHPDPDLWFREDSASEEAAKAICRDCPIQDACAVLGRDEPYGIYAGMTTGERLGLMLLATPEPPPHEASRSCYSQGCRRPECCEANTRWIAEWRNRPVTTASRVVPMAEQLAFL